MFHELINDISLRVTIMWEVGGFFEIYGWSFLILWDKRFDFLIIWDFKIRQFFEIWDLCFLWNLRLENSNLRDLRSGNSQRHNDIFHYSLRWWDQTNPPSPRNWIQGGEVYMMFNSYICKQLLNYNSRQDWYNQYQQINKLIHILATWRHINEKRIPRGHVIMVSYCLHL